MAPVAMVNGRPKGQGSETRITRKTRCHWRALFLYEISPLKQPTWVIQAMHQHFRVVLKDSKKCSYPPPNVWLLALLRRKGKPGCWHVLLHPSFPCAAVLPFARDEAPAQSAPAPVSACQGLLCHVHSVRRLRRVDCV